MACRFALPLAIASVFPLALLAQTPPPAPNLRITDAVRVHQQDKNAVVNITSTRIVNVRVGSGDDLFDQLFATPLVRPVPSQSLGSGFVIHSAGYIVTNEHVVDRATEVQVVFADDQKYPAEVIATDTEHDLAILKVKAPVPLPAVQLGASEDLMIGEPVFAIGNPYGYQGSMTSGIVSATGRQLNFSQTRVYKQLIQTDASINPGNSGGPLLNVYGQVIGINTAIRGDAQGIGFAIGVSQMRDLLPSLLNPEARTRSRIGFEIEERRKITAPCQVSSAIQVRSVIRGSPAEQAGLLAGDQVLAISGKPVMNVVEALVGMLDARPGSPLVVRILREGKLYDVTMAIRKMPVSESEQILATRLGVSGVNLTPQIAAQNNLLVNAGLLILKVADGGPAQQAGLAPGDVIFQVGRFYVTSADEVASLIKSAQAELRVHIGLVRGNARYRTVLQLR